MNFLFEKILQLSWANAVPCVWCQNSVLLYSFHSKFVLANQIPLLEASMHSKLQFSFSNAKWNVYKCWQLSGCLMKAKILQNTKRTQNIELIYCWKIQLPLHLQENGSIPKCNFYHFELLPMSHVTLDMAVQ